MRTVLPIALACLAGCGGAPQSYPLPSQRPAITEPTVLAPFVEMGSYAARAHTVRDVASRAEGEGWRWTYLRPELRFHLPSTARQRFLMDFSIIPEVFAETGPVTLSVSVNGKLLGRIRCSRPGDYRFERPVPEAWLAPETTVVAQVDKHLSGRDGAQLGYTLSRAGFRP